MRSRVGIAHIVSVALLFLAVVLGGVYMLVMRSLRVVIDEAGERLREAHTARIAADVDAYLSRAAPALQGAARALESDRCDHTSPDSVGSCLVSSLLSNPYLTEMTFTHAIVERWDDRGRPVVDSSAGVWQVSVVRTRDDDVRVRMVSAPEGRGFVSAEYELADRAMIDEMSVDDPSAHLTFTTPASEPWAGQTLWTDLSYSELDSHLPEEDQRVVLTLMQTVEGASGLPSGVLRVGVETAALDERIREGSRRFAPHVLFIADDRGRLVSRPEPGSHLYVDESDDSLRVDPGPGHPEISAALRMSGLEELSVDAPVTSGSVQVDGATWLVSYRIVPGSQDWRIGVTVPLDYYLGDFEKLRNRLAIVLGLLLVLAALFTVAALRGIQGGFGKIHGRIRSMIGFDFAPTPVRAAILEVGETLDGLEQSKTALRAMSRYVPIDLVRQLLQSNRDPKLGGFPKVLTMMFTDIESFTSISERIDRDELADILGRYFAAMTEIMHRHEGTLDKYIGDALMVLWNAPLDVSDHESKACDAALDATTMLGRLFASEEWAALPPLPTRFGIHTDEVLVGHFGAPDRISYTALGDGVNLASRLEGLNKQYGTSILVSENVVRGARATHEFRRVDRVAVKGRAGGIDVYELLGRTGECDARVATARAYESALEDYFACRFTEALDAFRALSGERAAEVMATRCDHFRNHPPADGWNGVWISKEK